MNSETLVDIITMITNLDKKELNLACELADRFPGTISEANSIAIDSDAVIDLECFIKGAISIIVEDIANINKNIAEKYISKCEDIDEEIDCILDMIASMYCVYHNNKIKIDNHGTYSGNLDIDEMYIQDTVVELLNDKCGFDDVIEAIEMCLDDAFQIVE